MLHKLQNHISTNFPFLKGKKLLLAISGGIDSMVLLDLFSKLQFEIGIAHCNFQLRGNESNEDEMFVKVKSERLKVKSHFERFETEKHTKENKLSIQQAARELRYNWFEELMTTEGYDFLLTAHHLDDSLETFLINFTRGTGIEGLTGIPAVNGKIVRPLLIFSREEIENYTQENKIEWREDSSNASEKYFRNKIRHKIVPILKELNPSLLESFQQTTDNLKQTKELAQENIEAKWEEITTVSNDATILCIEKIKALKNHRSYLYSWLQPYGFTAWKDINDLLEAQSGKQILSDNYRLIKDRNQLILTSKETNISEEFLIQDTDTSINFPINLSFCNLSYISTPKNTSIFVDYDKLKFPLILRKWKEGDYFYPSGMNGKKKVSKYFKDQKFSLIDKENTWILCSQDDIIWIINHRADERFIANKKSKNILNITLA